MPYSPATVQRNPPHHLSLANSFQCDSLAVFVHKPLHIAILQPAAALNIAGGRERTLSLRCVCSFSEFQHFYVCTLVKLYPTCKTSESSQRERPTKAANERGSAQRVARMAGAVPKELPPSLCLCLCVRASQRESRAGELKSMFARSMRISKSSSKASRRLSLLLSLTLDCARMQIGRL